MESPEFRTSWIVCLVNNFDVSLSISLLVVAYPGLDERVISSIGTSTCGKMLIQFKMMLSVEAVTR